MMKKPSGIWAQRATNEARVSGNAEYFEALFGVQYSNTESDYDLEPDKQVAKVPTPARLKSMEECTTSIEDSRSKALEYVDTNTTQGVSTFMSLQFI